jgi:hypothetical protein
VDHAGVEQLADPRQGFEVLGTLDAVPQLAVVIDVPVGCDAEDGARDPGVVTAGIPS